MKRQLYLWHRWLGIALCIPMVLWLISGIVMLFIGYPRLLFSEQLAGLPVLDAKHCCIEPTQAMMAANPSLSPTNLRLTSIAGQPHYLLTYPGQAEIAVDARSGDVINQTSEQQALASASTFGQGAAAKYIGLVHQDAWSMARALDAERPFHVVYIHDDAQRRLYLSHTNGRVLLDVTKQERIWNWLGAWLHWFYIIRDVPWWAEIIIYLSLAGSVVAILGQVIGIMRWRFAQPYRSGSHSPYSQGFMRWHHIAGLIFGALLIAWIFSGMMSMRPWKLTDSRSTLVQADYQAGALFNMSSPWPMQCIVQHLLNTGLPVKEIEWHMINGQAYLTAYASTTQSLTLAMAQPGHAMQRLPTATLAQAAQAILPDKPIHLESVKAYDFYYFARAENSMYSNHARRLPMLRVRFDDAAHTWLHVDPYSGAIIEQLDERRRLGRWLFNLLHSWDWLPLLERPWLREPFMIIFSLGAIVISASGIVIGWRRLRVKSSHTKRLYSKP